LQRSNPKQPPIMHKINFRNHKNNSQAIADGLLVAAPLTYEGATPSSLLVVILLPEVGNQILTLHPPQSILQFHQLNKQIMLGI
jgi:hypothetical protein